jgi:hypothetical protein
MVNLDFDDDIGSDLYKVMTEQVDKLLPHREGPATFLSPPNTVVEWDWWNIHRARQATARGWRFLIRVTETDHIEPRRSPNDFIRRQNMIYAPTTFGW